MVAKPNISYLQTYVSNYLSKNSSDSSSSDQVTKTAYSLIKTLSDVINSDRKIYSTSSTTAGTAWMLDYSYDPSNNNLVNYYLATNIHVLEATYTLSYRTTAVFNGINTIATAKISIPINVNTVSSLDVYLSQPQYNTNGSSNNLKVPYGNSYNIAWHKTPITKDIFNSSLIPLGSYSTSGNPVLSTPYTMQISYSFPLGGITFGFDFYYPPSGETGSNQVNSSSQPSYDFAVIKITESKTAFDSYNKSNEWTTMFQKMQTMFKVDTDDSKTTKSSSYIARLNALINLANSSSYSKQKVNELFMFADYKKDLTSSTVISIAGFPGTASGNNVYINFNSNTLSYSLITQSTDYTSSNYRNTTKYNYEGGLYYSSYSLQRDIILPTVYLLPGSSGSMNITQDYKIMGIYWGGLMYAYNSYHGISTEIYSYSDDASMIKIWLKYIKQKDSNSKLLALFTALSNKSYFS